MKRVIELFGNLSVHMIHLRIRRNVLSLTARFVIRLMMAVNKKLKPSYSVRISSQAHFVHLASEIINNNAFVSFHFSRQSSKKVSIF